jgi:hypothetical protein
MPAMAADTQNEVGRPKKSEPTAQFRLPVSTIHRIRRLAAHFKKDPGDFAAEVLAPVLDKNESRMLADVERERERKGGAE